MGMEDSTKNTLKQEGALDNACDRIDRVLNRSRAKYILIYSCLFVPFFLLFSSSCWLGNRSFIWWVDGFEQQYPFFILEGRWLRELLKNIFVSHAFEVPMWSQLVGYGADYFDSINNTLGNPINLISIFSNARNAEVLLNLTVPITFYLAGLAFIGYCLYKGFDRAASMVGVFVYLFSGFSAIAFQQIYMVYPLVIAPLALLGVDKAIDRNGSAILITSVAMACLYSVTTGYILCLLLVIYCLCRFLFFEGKSLRSFFNLFFRVAIPTVLGIACAGVLFVPVAVNVMTQGRADVTREIGLLYSRSYYISLARYLMSVTGVGADCFLGFAPVAVVSVALLFRKNNNTYRLLLLLLGIFVLVLFSPIAGSVSNGFSYSNNRWVWGFSLAMGVVTAITLPELWGSRGAGSILKTAFPIVLASLIVAPRNASSSTVFFSTVCILLGYFCLLTTANRNRARVFLASIMTLAATVAVVFYYAGTSLRGDRVPNGRAFDAAIEDRGLSLLENVDDAEEWSTDSFSTAMLRNSNLIIGTRGDTFYNSFYNSYIDDYHTSLGLVTSTMNYAYSSFNSRSPLELLSGTKYFLSGGEGTTMVPPMFDTLVAENDRGYKLYSTEALLPLAYYASSPISESSYTALGFVDRQNVLAQGLVLEDEEMSSAENRGEFGDDTYRDQTTDLPFSYSTHYKEEYGDLPVQDEKAEDAIRVDGNEITVTSPNAILYLEADIPENTEAYVSFDKLSFSDIFDTGKETGFKVFANGQNMEQEIWSPTKGSALDGGKDSWCVNTGYSSKSQHAVALRFEEAGVYRFSSLRLTAEKVDWINETVSEHQANAATDVDYSGNHLDCVYEAQKDGYIFIRLPYSKGWSAEVNGEKTDVLRANVGFIAVPVHSGRNDIRLNYCNASLPTGAVLTVGGICGSTVLCHHDARRRKKNKAVI